MSREVRRVPLHYQHPVVDSSDSEHRTTSQFIPLRSGYSAAMDRWADEVRDIQDRAGAEWLRHIERTLTGYTDDEGNFVEPTNSLVVDMGGFEFAVPVSCAETLRDNLLKSKLDARPDSRHYMPDFEGSADLGWCLYSGEQGVPLTPIFSSPAELVEHLTTVGAYGDESCYQPAEAQSLIALPAS